MRQLDNSRTFFCATEGLFEPVAGLGRAMGNIQDCASCMAGSEELVRNVAKTMTESEEIAAMKKGAVFSRRTAAVMGFALGSENVHLQLSEDKTAVLWKREGGSGAPTVVDVKQISSVDASNEKLELTLHAKERSKDPLLQICAPSRVQFLVWSAGLRELLDQRAPEEKEIEGKGAAEEKQSRTIADKAKQALYFQKRDMEISAAKRQAEARKSKYIKESGGLRFTAEAMMERDQKG